MMVIPNVCLVHFDVDGRVLAVGRKDNPEQVGFPGGKVDPEDLIDAKGDKEWALKIGCSREVLEEVGLIIFPHHLTRVYDGPCITAKKPGHTHWPNVAFMTTKISGHRAPQEGEAPTHWLTPTEFIRRSAFPDFNRALFEALGVVY